MAMLYNLKNILESIGGIEIILNEPIKFRSGVNDRNILKVRKIGRSWNIEDEFYNCWTISQLPNIWQDQIRTNLLSMCYSRVIFKQSEVLVL